MSAEHTIAAATVTSGEKPYGVRIDAGGHAVRGDEPVAHGGADTGPPRSVCCSRGLGAGTAITLRMYAQRKNWPLSGVEVRLTYGRTTVTGADRNGSRTPARPLPP